MYLDYYGLAEPPFDIATDPRFFVATPFHHEARSMLEFAVSSGKGVTLLLGAPGTGKTTVLHTVLQKIGRPANIVSVTNPAITVSEFTQFLAIRCGLSETARSSRSVFWIELERLLCDRARRREPTLLIIDEAQLLRDDVFEDVRLLNNLELQGRRLLSTILVGQPELGLRLEDPRLAALNQRIVLRCRLPVLDRAQTASYIASRIVIAGGDSAKVFSREAVDLIAECSGGVARTISVICDNALIAGFALDRRPATRDVVREVCNELGLIRSGTANAVPAVRTVPPAATGFMSILNRGVA